MQAVYLALADFPSSPVLNHLLIMSELRNNCGLTRWDVASAVVSSPACGGMLRLRKYVHCLRAHESGVGLVLADVCSQLDIALGMLCEVVQLSGVYVANDAPAMSSMAVTAIDKWSPDAVTSILRVLENCHQVGSRCRSFEAAMWVLHLRILAAAHNPANMTQVFYRALSATGGVNKVIWGLLSCLVGNESMSEGNYVGLLRTMREKGVMIRLENLDS